ncbi:TonB-dependent hemoglobin/transferrin/lactoferrin family receptor [Parasalinivibrio latis]|uniref:TonB-dependent hemoglobin/transferrin/lactoferrin family receptor n=1 Tax=Parasalinivibrio latis TaxID=2952610 RepID=UPI0030E10FF8
MVSYNWKKLQGTLLTLLTLLCAPFAIHAAEETSAHDSDEKLVVYATRSPDVGNNPLVNATVVNHSELEILQADSVPQALKTLPNVTASGGPRSTSQSVNIRGLDGQRIVQIVDGARQNVSSGHRGTYFIDPEMLESVEVVKGPVSSLWGSGALGGVVSQRMKSASDFLNAGETFGAYVSQGYHSNNKKSLTSGSIYGQNGDVEYLVNGFYNDSDDIELGNGKKLENSASRQNGGMVKLSFQVNRDLTLNFNSRINQIDERVPSNPATNAGRSSPLVYRETQDSQLAIGAAYNPVTEWVNLDAKLYFNQTNYKENRLDQGQKDDTDYDTLGLTLINQSKFDALTLLYGVDVYRDDYTTKRDDSGTPGTRPDNIDASADSLGMFLQADITLAESWLLQAGLRHDRYKGKVKNGTTPDAEETANSPSLGLQWQTTDWLTLSARYQEAFRAPSMEEMFSTGCHFSMGPFGCNTFQPNPDLKPEEAKNKELSAQLSFEDKGIFDSIDVFATVFLNDIDNFIEQTVGRTTTTFNNVDGAEIKGGELEAAFVSGAAALDLAYGRADGKAKSGEDLFGIPAQSLAADLSYYIGNTGLKVGTRYSHYSAQDDVNTSSTNQGPYGSYKLVDLYASYEPLTSQLDGLKVDFAIDNVTDEYYRVAWEQLYEAGRNYKLNVRYQF